MNVATLNHRQNLKMINQ